MSHIGIPAVNFTISEHARRGIELARQACNAHSPDPAAVLCVGWGRFMPDSGPQFENVVVTFYGQSQLPGITEAIQEVSGLQVVFLPTPADHPKFEGKILDFNDDQGFFLRGP